MTSVLAAIEYGGPFEVPPINELFEFADIFPTVNRVVLITLFACLATVALFVLAFSNAKVVPGRLQAAVESIVEFVREQVVIDIIGPDGIKFLPFLTAIFFFVWFNNLFEVVPFVNFPATSRIALPLFLAVIVWLTFIFVGLKNHGLAYIKDIAFPPGVPKVAYVLLTPLELLSTFILRPFTLTIRLFANMVAGHILLTIVFIGIHAFLTLGPGLPLGAILLALAPMAIAFEMFIGSLQAYIFIILTAVYIGGALHPEH